MSGSSKKVTFVGIIFLLAIMMFAAVGIGSGGDTANTDLTSSLLSEKVEKYRAYVTKRAEVYDMQDHVELILCVMEVESLAKVWILCRLQRVLLIRNTLRYRTVSVTLNILSIVGYRSCTLYLKRPD